MLCPCVFVFYAIHSFVNRENVRFALHLSFSLYVCVSILYIHGPIHSEQPSFFEYSYTLFFRTATNHQNVDDEEKKCESQKKKVWTLNVCTWCGPLRHSILTMGLAILNFHTKTDHQFWIRIFVFVLIVDELRVIQNEANIYSSLHNNAFEE